jgi:hypothetical protein
MLEAMKSEHWMEMAALAGTGVRGQMTYQMFTDELAVCDCASLELARPTPTTD